MRRIALVNQKGGVGKTTTAVNLSAALSRLDRKVLLVDLDPQSNATVSLGLNPQQQSHTSYSVLAGEPPAPLELSPTLHLLPSSIELSGAEIELASAIGRETLLRDALAGLQGYDFLILDCSPSLGLLTVNALTTVDEIMIPLQCEFLALHGMSLLMRTIDLVKKRLNPGLEIKGVIPCMFDARKGLAKDIVQEIDRHFGDKVFKTRIRANVRLAEAPSHGKTIFDYAPDSNGAEDYLALAREIAGIELIAPAPPLEEVPDAAFLEEIVALELPQETAAPAGQEPPPL
jgi:chromosome partitioning protein